MKRHCHAAPAVAQAVNSSTVFIFPWKTTVYPCWNVKFCCSLVLASLGNLKTRQIWLLCPYKAEQTHATEKLEAFLLDLGEETPSLFVLVFSFHSGSFTSQSPPVGIPSSCDPFQVAPKMREEGVTSIIVKVAPYDKAGGITVSERLSVLFLSSATGLSFRTCNEILLLQTPWYMLKMLLKECWLAEMRFAFGFHSQSLQLFPSLLWVRGMV